MEQKKEEKVYTLQREIDWKRIAHGVVNGIILFVVSILIAQWVFCQFGYEFGFWRTFFIVWAIRLILGGLDAIKLGCGISNKSESAQEKAFKCFKPDGTKLVAPNGQVLEGKDLLDIQKVKEFFGDGDEKPSEEEKKEKPTEKPKEEGDAK